MKSFKTFLLESMTRAQALSIFASHGVKDHPTKQDYHSLVKKHHPDKGGNPEHLKYINAAWDVLKNKKAETHSTHHATPYNPHDIRSVKQKYSDRGSGEEHHVHNWDGHFFRGMFTVHGKDHMHHEMADDMRKWDRFFNSKAVFISKNDNPRRLHLVWANGKHMSPGHHIDHESFNLNPGNDSRFTSHLNDWIDKQTKGH